ncbi:MAG: riboflavin synthase, partial [Candidatus Eiseniibacteriota bacterium]
KGSVTIDGISLTVVNVRKDKFSVALVPHTLQKTTIASKSKGDRVNIEYDILSKYVDSLLPQKT